MQFTTVVVLACLIVAVAASAHYEHYPAVDSISNDANIQESIYETPEHERTVRTKRSLILLKKKLLLGALGLKAAKIGAVGAVGALALKSKPKSVSEVHISYGHSPSHDVGAYGWSG